jgi:hypothetical protein
MLTMAIWWMGILLEALLLVRGLQQKLLRRFPVFYAYILFVFLQEFLRFCAYRWFVGHYSQAYWGTEFFSLVIGSAVIFEIYRVALRPFPGAATVARALLCIVFAFVFLKALANTAFSLPSWFAQASEYLERDLRIVQGLAILALVILFVWYAIPFGKNLMGILFGYSVFVAMSILQLTLLPHLPDRILDLWSYLQPASYLLVLVLWLGALWAEYPVLKAEASVQLEDDYASLLASTRAQLRRLRARLGWVAHL